MRKSDLKQIYGKRFSIRNPENIRLFYKVYSTDQIDEKVFNRFEKLIAVSTSGKFSPTWSRNLKLTQ